MPTNFITAVFDDGDGPMWTLLPGDGSAGLILGEWDEVRAAWAALSHLIETGQADEEISNLDERLGTHWLTVTEASQQWDVPVATVRWAASHGKIKGAEKQHGRWRFPQRTFLGWLHGEHRWRC